MSSRRRLPWVSLALSISCVAFWPAAERHAAAEEAKIAEPALRYPFDPVCPWGRVSDGRGLLVRCLDAAEAQRLAAAPQGGPQTRAAAPVSAAPVAAAPGRAEVAPVAPPPPVPPAPPAANKPVRRVFLAAVNPAVADTGELPEARVQLSRVGDRFVQCVESSGGLTSSPARVTVRFLVRERGRAEGVTVKDRSGVSPAAAKCIAEVVDRRFVGYPAAPIVGADLSMDFSWEGTGR
jgi:hypothetical protein